MVENNALKLWIIKFLLPAFGSINVTTRYTGIELNDAGER